MKTEGLRWIRVIVCLAGAGLMLVCGWLVPAHLRALDASVMRRAGDGGISLVNAGLALERAGNPDAARLFLQVAQTNKISGSDVLASTLDAHSSENKVLFPGGPSAPSSVPVTTLLIKRENRERVLAYLDNLGSPPIRELLRARDLTNTVLFPASSTASGQAIDGAISICGLLLAENHFSHGLRDAILDRAASATIHTDAQPLEEVLMDLMSLGQRLDWGQLTAFVGDINDTATLTLLTGQMRNAGSQLPALFAAVIISQKPAQIANYLNDFSQTGLNDLSASLREGEGGVNELLRRNQRLYNPPPRLWSATEPLAFFMRAVTNGALRMPLFALVLKWFFYILSGFLLAAAGHFARPPVAEIEKPLKVSGFHLIREFLFALGFLFVVLLLSEPFLAQESQKAEFTFRLRIPTSGAATANSTSLIKTKIMDTRSLITLALFFVLQGLIYCACLAKLAEIRRQKIPARVQLKLLENEEHLFDAGLYLGFAGTIVCLILVSLKITQQSLMAAYSSTSFGIIFVSVFKIFNLRPVRRRLLMQAEEQTTSPAHIASSAETLVTTP